MDENKFKARILTNPLNVVAVLNHLEDNIKFGSLLIILTIKPRRDNDTDYCSIAEEKVVKIEVKKNEEILNINKLLQNSLFESNIHVAIIEKEKSLV